MKKYFLFLLVLIPLFLLSSCATQRKSVSIPDVVILPEDRIYTLPAGQPVNLTLDEELVEGMVFPYDMKIVSPTILIRQEEKLNNALLKKTQAEKKTNRWVGIMGSIFTIIAGGLGVYIKFRGDKKE